MFRREVIYHHDWSKLILGLAPKLNITVRTDCQLVDGHSAVAIDWLFLFLVSRSIQYWCKCFSECLHNWWTIIDTFVVWKYCLYNWSSWLMMVAISFMFYPFPATGFPRQEWRTRTPRKLRRKLLRKRLPRSGTALGLNCLVMFKLLTQWRHEGFSGPQNGWFVTINDDENWGYPTDLRN